ncbi:MAG TPA: acyltransferase [Acidisoma sp.]|nr:acyltransferase [Acidisoma sp.]
MGRLHALDGLRGLLALYILAGHTVPFVLLPHSVAWLGSLLCHGRAAVDLFFILSGFVILQVLERSAGSGQAAAWRFLALRAGRLLPVYLLALGLACAGLAAGNPFDHMPWLGPDSPARAVLAPDWPPQAALHVAVHLLSAQGMLPPALLPDAEYAILGPAWSLSTEWQFYGLMALCLAFAPRLLSGGGGRATALLLLLGLAGLVIGDLPEAWRFGRAFLPREAWYFALGMTSHALLSGQASRRRFGGVLAAAILMSGAANKGGSALGAMVVPVIWTLCLGAERPKGWIDRALRRLLTTPPLLWCGGISYALYLIHAPLQRLLMLWLAPLVHGDWQRFTLLWLAPAVALPILSAAMIHTWVEEPVRRWSRVRLSETSPRATPPPVYGSGSSTSAAGRP